MTVRTIIAAAVILSISPLVALGEIPETRVVCLKPAIRVGKPLIGDTGDTEYRVNVGQEASVQLGVFGAEILAPVKVECIVQPESFASMQKVQARVKGNAVFLDLFGKNVCEFRLVVTIKYRNKSTGKPHDNDLLLELDQIEPQEHNNGCGPCSVARVLRYHGKAMTYKQAYAEVNPAGWGSTPASLANLMRKHLPDAHEENRSSFERVLELLGQGRPCVALVEDGGSFNLHWIALQGYDKDQKRIFFTDTNGETKSYTFDDFKTVWDWKFGILSWGNGVLSVRGVHGRTIITTGAEPKPQAPAPSRRHPSGGRK